MRSIPWAGMPARSIDRKRVGVSIGTACLAASLVLATMPAAAEAAYRPIRFTIDLGWWCVAGRATDNAWVKVTWKDGDGQLKQSGGARASGKGYWVFCGDGEERVEVGDIVKAKVGTRSRRISVPRLNLVIDRDADTVTGKAPAGVTVALDAQKLQLFWTWEEGQEVTKTTADAGGNFFVDYGDPRYLGHVLDLRGRDYVLAWFRTAQGDIIYRGQHVPYIALTRGKARFDGVFRPFKKLTVELWRAGAMLDDWNGRADTWDWGWFRGRFADKDGETYRVRAEDRIVATAIGSDADWTVPAVWITGDPVWDTVRGTCDTGSGEQYGVSIRSNSGKLKRQFGGTTIAGGGVFRTFHKSRVDIRSGDVVRLHCRLPSGDHVSYRHVVK